MRMKSYRHLHNKSMSTPAVAQMTATMLYNKRFFPYYISNILGGLDDQGRGCLYSYDPVGHMEKNMYRAGGSAVSLLQPLLDNQVGLKNMENMEQRHSRSSCSVHVLLHVTNRIVGVQTSPSLIIQTPQDVGDVVGEEPLVVQHGGRHLGHGWGRHGLVVEVTVTLHSHLRDLAECQNVTPASC